MSEINSIESRILGVVQSDFPVCERPFAQIAGQLGLSEATVLETVANLRQRGVIRRFGAVFDSRKLGYVSTLVAVCIPDEKDLPQVAGFISTFGEVTHNYQRADSFNLWFTLIAQSGERIREILSQVEAREGVERVMNLPQTALYKIKASFKPVAK